MRFDMLMSPDGNDGAAPSGADQSQAGSQSFSPPPGQRLVSDSEYSSMESWYKTAQGLGFKEPREIEGYKPFFEAHRKAGTDIGMLTNIIAPRQQKKDAEPLTMDAIKQLLDEQRRNERAELAEREHDSYMQNLPKMYESALADVFKEKDDDIDPILKELAESRLLKARLDAQYPEGHELHGKRLGRVDENKIKELAGSLAENRKALAAWRLKAIGQAANRTSKPTAAGNQGGNGAPDREAEEAEATRDMKIEMARKAREHAAATMR